jgi:hypothetical protein
MPNHLLRSDSLLDAFSTLNMEVIRASETSVHMGLHDAISRKMAIFIITAVRTSNPTQSISLRIVSNLILRHVPVLSASGRVWVNNTTTEQATVAVSIWTCIREVVGSNLGRDCSNPDRGLNGHHQYL